jgi:general L-amino acid transport system substrate-binding protein
MATTSSPISCAGRSTPCSRRRVRHHSKNVDDAEERDPSIKRILASPRAWARRWRRRGWVVNIVKQVGNYGESFDRNVGMGSTLKIERGLNKLWTQGGLQYSPPIR